MQVTVITPAAPVVSLQEAKQHLRIDHDDEDAVIEMLVQSATDWLDRAWLNRSVGAQTLELRQDSFYAEPQKMPFGPVRSIVSISYLDNIGAEQTLSPWYYELLSNGSLSLSYGASWPSVRSFSDAVRIVYEAGYETVPPVIKTGILLIVGYLYNNREASADQGLYSGFAAGLLMPYRDIQI